MTEGFTGRLELAVPGRSIREHTELASLAKQSGFTGAWVSEVAGFDAVTQAVAVGQAMPGCRVGTAIVPMQTRDPLLMAMSANSLAEVLDGRFALGLGTSTRVIIEDWHSRPWDSPIAMTREYVGLIRQFLDGEMVTTEGRFSYKRARLAGRCGHPVPVYLAALNDRMLRLAGEVADGVILNFASPAYFQHALPRVAEGRERRNGAGAPFETIAFFRVTAADDFGAVRERYQRELLTYFLSPVYQRMFGGEGLGELCDEVQARWKSGDRAGALATIPDRVLKDRVLAGTVAEIELQLNDYFDAGLDTAILLPVPVPGRDHREECEHIIAALGAITARIALATTLEETA